MRIEGRATLGYRAYRQLMWASGKGRILKLWGATLLIAVGVLFLTGSWRWAARRVPGRRPAVLRAVAAACLAAVVGRGADGRDRVRANRRGDDGEPGRRLDAAPLGVPAAAAGDGPLLAVPEPPGATCDRRTEGRLQRRRARRGRRRVRQATLTSDAELLRGQRSVPSAPIPAPLRPPEPAAALIVDRNAVKRPPLRNRCRASDFATP